MKKLKEPQGTPDQGDRVCFRGDRQRTGVLRSFNPTTNWSIVDWDEGISGPHLCHRFELIKIDHL